MNPVDIARQIIILTLALAPAGHMITTETRAMPIATPVVATGSVAAARAYALKVLGPTEYGCIDRIFQRESRWNPLARNRTSGAYGIPQALPGSKMASEGADWRTNPVTQVKWGIKYVRARYGGACKAIEHIHQYGWY